MSKRLTGIRTGLFLRLVEGEPGGEPAGGGAGSGGNPPAFEAVTSQEDFDRRIADRLRREREKFAGFDEIKRKADAYDAAEVEKQSDVEKANARAAAAEQRATEAEAKSLRLDVAAAKGVPAGLVPRLHGATREELEADADALLALLPPATGGGTGGTPPRPRPDSTQGSSTPARDNGSPERREQMYRALGRPVPSA
ncbi:capsid assembly scaffolding protein Gp46 family protein [Pseudokineococcus lusitanus]|uniref:Uncharacterized protein DUF4355 n=1 Tax=Pseudokineococcus lusitanus TaxID=763993 RepID=A0A3N1HU37_9ACTN|nr:DUF4355 domain-containing protein [Pseudokineococcus lusitanus]ROP45940.1 uncharacterized protein DUF4355 [Pseudokineococcus lusitanus]